MESTRQIVDGCPRNDAYTKKYLRFCRPLPFSSTCGRETVATLAVPLECSWRNTNEK